MYTNNVHSVIYEGWQCTTVPHISIHNYIVHTDSKQCTQYTHQAQGHVRIHLSN